MTSELKVARSGPGCPRGELMSLLEKLSNKFSAFVAEEMLQMLCLFVFYCKELCSIRKSATDNLN